MSGVNDIKAELDDALTLNLISQAFTEASASKIQKIKKEFEKNQQFYVEISRLYHLVQLASEKLKNRARQKQQEEGKNVMVAITSNQRFYGSINTNIMHQYLEDADKEKMDMMVVGTTGIDFMKSAGMGRQFQTYSFAKEFPTIEECRAFLDRVKPYKKVFVYYPRFVSLVRQTVGVMDITQTANTEIQIGQDEIEVLFEPEVDRILDFFEKQVRSLLFLRVMFETDLARTAARLMTMSGAEDRSRDMIKSTKSQLRKIVNSINNARLLETFSAMQGAKH